jgi:micrococcal nuclease
MYQYRAKIIHVVDGDTVDATLELGFYLTATLRLRLLGVDTPEMHGLGRPAGVAARQFVEGELLGRDVVLETAKSDAFGRWLCRVLVDGVDFNRRLIDEGHAVAFPAPRTPAG